MECSLGGPAPCMSWASARSSITSPAITGANRGPDGQALFGPVREAPAGPGPADQLAAFLGRAV
jgi:hypothetical protein